MYKARAVIPKTTLDTAALQRAVRRGLDTGADLAQRELERPVKRWRTPVSFVQSSPDEHTREVTTNSALYGYSDHGTRPHVIRARRRKRLAFFWRGRMRFPVKVNHPGTKARYFSRRAAEVTQGKMQAIFDRELAAAL